MVHADVGDALLRTLSLSDGKTLWENKIAPGYCKPTDIFLIGQHLWSGGIAEVTQHDPKTGKVLKQYPQVKTGPMGHERCYRHFVEVTGTGKLLGEK